MTCVRMLAISAAVATSRASFESLQSFSSCCSECRTFWIPVRCSFKRCSNSTLASVQPCDVVVGQINQYFSKLRLRNSYLHLLISCKLQLLDLLLKL